MRERLRSVVVSGVVEILTQLPARFPSLFLHVTKAREIKNSLAMDVAQASEGVAQGPALGESIPKGIDFGLSITQETLTYLTFCSCLITAWMISISVALQDACVESVMVWIILQNGLTSQARARTAQGAKVLSGLCSRGARPVVKRKSREASLQWCRWHRALMSLRMSTSFYKQIPGNSP